MRSALLVVAAVLLIGGCSANAPATPDAQPPTPTRSQPSTTRSPSVPGHSPSARPTSSPQSTPITSKAARFRPGAALATVRLLAGRIGPREATSPAFARAAEMVASRWRAQGYDVRLDRFGVPAGVSWGVPVPAGRTANVIAVPPKFRPDQPHLLVGAHLDTVPQAPGAEDNASGVSTLIEVSRLAAVAGTRLPVVFVAFGAEEPRGEGDALHHFGSQAYVDAAPPAQLAALRAMVSLDRVGVGVRVPVCTGGLSPLAAQRNLLALARRLGTPTTACTDNQASDHWSFEKAGTTAVRVGGTAYAAYHSAADRPGVVDREQLRRVGELIWAWLRAGR
jgi:hypothetical protein